jgi:hypothetical protein
MKKRKKKLLSGNESRQSSPQSVAIQTELSQFYSYIRDDLSQDSVTKTGFGLMIEFIGLFDAALDYTLQFTVTHTHTSVHSHIFTAVAW